MTEDEEE